MAAGHRPSIHAPGPVAVRGLGPDALAAAAARHAAPAPPPAGLAMARPAVRVRPYAGPERLAGGAMSHRTVATNSAQWKGLPSTHSAARILRHDGMRSGVPVT